ncbi:beta-lactamase/transpeptidase-like protein [Lophiotrema nucula]|uniref:Beta-lactamase/transpeptidase-like protein n=1 Tax=Lophiotrema nucula TaxID=690887 RepID=A0A6A5YXY1_9PLEO|nr:beta-lactamase/transpeptidase-like protein [Lophiotrema nucula]
MRSLPYLLPTLISSTLAYCPIPGPLLPPPVLAPALNLSGPAIDNSTFTSWHSKPWVDNTSFAITASLSGAELFHFEHIDPDYARNVSVCNTQFRIGSVTKIFTILAVLLSKDQIGWRDPITKYVDGLKGDVWDEVTIESLAGQTSGLGKNGYVGDLVYQGASVAALLNLPKAGNTIPNCDYAALDGVRVCTQNEVIELFNSPQWLPESPGTGPAYSNLAYNLLGIALAKAHGKSYEQVITDLITQPLGLDNTGFERNAKGGAILPNPGDNWWTADFANFNPTGGLWSSANDLLKVEQAILSNRFLSPSETRFWLKPASLTASLHQAVGAPWEIFRPDTLDTTYKRPIDLYTKEGDIPGYASYAILIPEYNVTIAIMVAGNQYSAAIHDLFPMIVEHLVPYTDNLARKQAERKYVGTYANSNDSIITVAQDSGPGLTITAWRNDGVDLRKSLSTLVGIPLNNFSIRLYPADPDSFAKTEKWRLSFEKIKNENSFADQDCQGWVHADNYRYIQERLDELLFTIDDGKAVEVNLPAWRTTLVRR